MPYDVIPTICVSIVAVFAIQGVTIYSVLRLILTGRSLFERRPDAGWRRSTPDLRHVGSNVAD